VTDWAPDAPIKPFWQRMPRIFRLPLRRSVLTRIALLCALALVSPLALALGPVGFLILPAVLLGVFVYGAQYGFRIIERSSQGFLDPDHYPDQDDDGSLAGPLKYVAINLLFGVIVAGVFMATGGGETPTWLVSGLLFTVLMPAAVMRLVTTGSLRQAVSPAGLAETIRRIGMPYVVLCVFVFFAELCRSYGVFAAGAAGGLGGTLLGAVAGKTAGFGIGLLALLFFMAMAFWYFSYVICALIGYAMYQWADALEITVFGPGETRGASVRKLDVKARARDALIARMVAGGEVKEAIGVLSEDLRERPQDLSLHARLHKLLLAEGYLPRIEDHTDKYLDLLMSTGNEREALGLVEEALGRSAEWRPRTVEHIVPLARAALDGGRAPLAAQLVKGFDKRFRGHPDVPQAYLLGAQLMLQSGSAAVPQARHILEHLVDKHPTDRAAAEAQRMLARIEQLAR
jgi:hypothetical protein